MSGFRWLFDQEAIEICADAHCQNSLSGKDIMLNPPSLSSKVLMNYI